MVNNISNEGIPLKAFELPGQLLKSGHRKNPKSIFGQRLLSNEKNTDTNIINHFEQNYSRQITTDYKFK